MNCKYIYYIDSQYLYTFIIILTYLGRCVAEGEKSVLKGKSKSREARDVRFLVF